MISEAGVEVVMTELISPADISDSHQVSGPSLRVPEYLGVGDTAVVEPGEGGEHSVIERVDPVLGTDSATQLIGQILGLREGLERFSDGDFSSLIILAGTQLKEGFLLFGIEIQKGLDDFDVLESVFFYFYRVRVRPGEVVLGSEVI